MTVSSALKFTWTTGWTGAMSAWAVASQIPGPDRALFARHTRRWARGVAAIVGIDVTVHGAEQLDPGGTYVLMANHQSHADIPVLLNALPMVPGFLAKAELRKVPLFGRAMEVGGHVFVERGAKARAASTIERAAQDIRESGSIVIFPEGTRSRRREVLPFKKGGFHLAMLARVPIVPIGLRGTADILPKHGKDLVAGACEVHVGAPITIEGYELEDLVDGVRARICELSSLPPGSDRSGA